MVTRSWTYKCHKTTKYICFYVINCFLLTDSINTHYIYNRPIRDGHTYRPEHHNPTKSKSDQYNLVMKSSWSSRVQMLTIRNFYGIPVKILTLCHWHWHLTSFTLLAQYMLSLSTTDYLGFNQRIVWKNHMSDSGVCQDFANV